MNHYHIDIFWSSEDDCFVANIPDLFACSAFGSTPVQALAEVLVAQEAWLETSRELGKPIPEPKFQSESQRIAG